MPAPTGLPPQGPRHRRSGRAWPFALGLVLAFPGLVSGDEPASAPDPRSIEALSGFVDQAEPWLQLALEPMGPPAHLRWLEWKARVATAAGGARGDAAWLALADEARASAWHWRRVRALNTLSNLAYRRGDIAMVRAVEEQSLADARRLGDRREEAGSLYGLALAAQATGDLAEAERLLRQVIGRWDDMGETGAAASGRRALGRVLESQGRFAEAMRLQVGALEAQTSIGMPMELSETNYSLAKLFLTLGDLDAAERGVDEAIRLMGPQPPAFPLGLNLALRSQLRREQGRTAEALEDALAAEAAFAASGDSIIGQAIGRLAKGRALLANGEAEASLATLSEGLALAEQLGERVLEADLLVARGEALLALDRPRQAVKSLRTAQDITADLKLDRTDEDASLLLEQAWSRLGRPGDALAASKRAYAARSRITVLTEMGDLAARAASREARERFMRIEATPAATAAATPAGAPEKPEPGLPRWAWGLALPSLLLAWVLVRLGRHARRLHQERQHIAAAKEALEEAHQDLHRKANTDSLTGALARAAFARDLAGLLEHAERLQHRVALMVVDLDRFKQINDGLGHLAGDEALRLLTGLCREKLRSADLLGRFGGDEFLIACEGLDLAGAEVLAESIRAEMVRRAPLHQPPMPGLSVSIGVAVADPELGYEPESLFHRADAALYRAKHLGRNRVVAAAPSQEHGPDPLRRRRWDQALQE